MNIELMNLFAEYMEKQEILSRLTEDEKLHGYSYSEIHTISAIGDLQDPNVTAIAERMNVTKGAVSKITKKLIDQKLIETYQKDGNRQKIYFRLTGNGKFLYDEHAKRHQLWLKRDDAFISRFDEKTVELIHSFMTEFNRYLEEKIEEKGGKPDEN